MTHQSVVFGSEAHKEMLRGAEVLYKAVKATMGPSGHSIIIDNGNMVAPVITKDGVTVAKSIHLKEKLPGIGAELLKEVAAKTNELAGDGPQPLYAKVLTPNGWTTMAQLNIGDSICGTNGTIQTVLGTYSKGKKEIFKIFLADGNSETRVVECSEDHLWCVKTYYGSQCTMTTKQLFDSGLERTKGGGKYFISPTCVEFENTIIDKLPLDPYLLGVLLGDGSLSEKYEVEIAVGQDQEYILSNLVLPKKCTLRKRHYVEKHYTKASICGSVRQNIGRYEKKSIIKNILKDLGLLGTNSHTKFIPKQYLYSSIENRKKLLAGLIDTDGSISDRGLFVFSTVSEQLSRDFIELCRSLGKQLNHKIYERKTNDGSFSTKSIHRISELKGNQYGLKIAKIEKTNMYTEMMCIKVSNEDHLYITDNFVPTHNTTTATVLGYSMLSQGIKMIATGRSSIGLKRGMDYACEKVISWLKTNAIKIRNNDDIINVGTISANGDRKIGELLANAIDKVGQDGIITIEPAKSIHTTLEVVEGMQFDSGYTSPYFVTNQEKLTCELLEPLVLITNKKLTSLAEIVKALEIAAEQNKPLLIIGDEIEGEVLHTLIVNKMKGVLFSCAVKAPSYSENRTDILSDIALVTGGTVFDASLDVSLKNIELGHFGSCKKVIVTRNSTTLVGEGNSLEIKELVDERISQLRTVLSTNLSLDELKRNNIKKRLAKLSGGIAVVKVGGSTEVEIFEKKDRVEDALNATLAAVQEGILPGGGTALFYAGESLKELMANNPDKLNDDELAGVKVIHETCSIPLRVIVENTGKSADVVINNLTTAHSFKIPEMDFSNLEEVKHTGSWKTILKNNKTCEPLCYGYDASKHEYCDLVEKGILDPLKVERYALEHSCSIIGLVLTANGVVLTTEENNNGN